MILTEETIIDPSIDALTIATRVDSLKEDPSTEEMTEEDPLIEV